MNQPVRATPPTSNRPDTGAVLLADSAAIVAGSALGGIAGTKLVARTSLTGHGAPVALAITGGTLAAAGMHRFMTSGSTGDVSSNARAVARNTGGAVVGAAAGAGAGAVALGALGGAAGLVFGGLGVLPAARIGAVAGAIGGIGAGALVGAYVAHQKVD